MKKIFLFSMFLTIEIISYGQINMTIDQARALALSNSEDIKIAEQTVQKSRADLMAARANYLPSVNIEATGIYVKDDYLNEMYLPTYKPDLTSGQLVPNLVSNPVTGQPILDASGNPIFAEYAYMPIEMSLHGAYMAGLKIEQPIYYGGKIQTGNKLANIGYKMSSDNLALKKTNAIVEVDQAYWLFVSVQNKVKLAETSLRMLKDISDRIQNSYDAGYVNKNEVLKAQVEVNRATLDLQKAKSGLALTQMSLCRLTGLPLDSQILTDTTIIIDFDYSKMMMNDNVTGRPEFQLLSKNIAFEKQRVKMVRADYLPSVGFSMNLYTLGGLELNSTEINQSNASAMVQVKIPLMSWVEGKQKISSAKTSASIKEYEMEKNIKLMKLEIENACLGLNDARLKIEISQKALEQATENLKINNDAYQTGKAILSDLLIAQTQWEKATTDLIDAKTQFKLQETEYLRVTAHLLSY